MLATRKRRVAAPARGFDLEAGLHGPTYAKECAGKDRYTSEAAALVGIGLIVRTRSLDTYRCGFCGEWHLTERRPGGQKKAPPPMHMLAFVCARCLAQHPEVAASDMPWTARSRRTALLKLEPAVLRDGWSIGAPDDHCAGCAAVLGLETMRRAA